MVTIEMHTCPFCRRWRMPAANVNSYHQHLLDAHPDEAQAVIDAALIALGVKQGETFFWLDAQTMEVLHEAPEWFKQNPIVRRAVAPESTAPRAREHRDQQEIEVYVNGAPYDAKTPLRDRPRIVHFGVPNQRNK